MNENEHIGEDLFGMDVPPQDNAADDSVQQVRKGGKDKKRATTGAIMGNLQRTVLAQKVLIVCLVVLCVALGAYNVYLSALPKSVPWVIELTPDGQARYYEDAVKLLDNWEPNDSTQRYFISRYIVALRSVGIDSYQCMQNARDVYARTLDPAVAVVDAWFRDNNPVTRSDKELVRVPLDEMSVVRYSDEKWKVMWRETTTLRSGVIKTDIQYEAMLTVARYTPATERQKRENPIGMYITGIDIALVKDLT